MIGRPYLITGLPRSRTAWFAAVCNTVPGSICYHEPVEHFPSWQISLSLWDDPRYMWIGISDSAMGFHLSEIIGQYRPRVLIIERDQDEVSGSLSRIGVIPTNYCALLRETLVQFADHRLVKTIAYDRLGDVETVRQCLDHLMPGAQVDGSKISVLQQLNVQAHVERMLRHAESRRDDIVQILGEDVTQRLRLA